MFQASGPHGACPGPLAGLEVLPPWEGDLNWSAPANPSLLAWQHEDNASQKYLCGWWKVNFSASLFFPGNRGHCQIQQNRSRDGARRGPCRASEEPCSPCPLLLPPAIWPYGGAGGGVGGSRCLESWHPAMPGLEGPPACSGSIPPLCLWVN